MTTSPEALREEKLGIVIAPCVVCGVLVSSTASQRSRGRGKSCSQACSMAIARNARREREAAEFGERFWTWVDKSGGPDACWPWMGKRHSEDGYGRYRFQKKYHTAHRYALWSAVGDAPDGKPFALHSCDYQPCCNPAHLRWGSNQDNVDDKVARGRTRNGTGKRIDVDIARLLRSEGHSNVVVARMFNVRPQSVERALRR